MANAFGTTMAMLLFVTLLAGGGIYYIVHLQRRRNDLEETVSSYQDAAKLRTVIYSKIRDIAELATVREDFTAEVVYEDKNSKEWHGFKLPFSDVKFNMTYSGVVVCGCDLTRIQVPDNGIHENGATLILPQCTIQHIYPKIESYHITTNETGLLADKISLEYQNQLVAIDLEREKNQLIREGILNRANENVRRIVNAHMRTIGINPRIIFIGGNAYAGTRLLN